MKLKIALEAIKEERYIGHIASEFGIHSTVNRWVQELVSSIDKVYASTKAEKQATKDKEEPQKHIDNLYARIGRPIT